MAIIHVGRRVPEHFVELPGSLHLGGGVWAFNCALRNSTEGSQMTTKGPVSPAMGPSNETENQEPR